MISRAFALLSWLLFATAYSQRLLHNEGLAARRDLSSDSFPSFFSTTERTNLKDAYESMFPSAKEQYSWSEFTSAWQKVFTDSAYTAWGSSTAETKDFSESLRKKYNFYRMISFFWAHMAQESGSGQYVKEADCSSSTTADVCCSYNKQQSDCDDDDSMYFGRGALQISHDENYKKFGAWLKEKGLDNTNTWDKCDAEGSFVGCAKKLASKEYALLSGMWYFHVTGMHLCGGSKTETAVQCFKRTIFKINGQQECVAKYGSYSHGYHNLGWGKCTQSGNEITDTGSYIWKGYMNSNYAPYGYGAACRDSCSANSQCTGYNFSSSKNCIHWTASPIDGEMENFYGWGDSFCWKKMPLRNEASTRFLHLKNAVTKLGLTDFSVGTDFSCDFCDTFKTSTKPHSESPCYDDSNY